MHFIVPSVLLSLPFPFLSFSKKKYIYYVQTSVNISIILYLCVEQKYLKKKKKVHIYVIATNLIALLFSKKKKKFKGRANDICSRAPCLNGGTCIQISLSPGFKCQCQGMQQNITYHLSNDITKYDQLSQAQNFSAIDANVLVRKKVSNMVLEVFIHMNA